MPEPDQTFMAARFPQLTTGSHLFTANGSKSLCSPEDSGEPRLVLCRSTAQEAGEKDNRPTGPLHQGHRFFWQQERSADGSDQRL